MNTEAGTDTSEVLVDKPKNPFPCQRQTCEQNAFSTVCACASWVRSCAFT